MRKLTLILIGALVLGLLAFAASWQVAARLCTHQMVANADDLTWLQQEFDLNAAELARVRELHEAYLPQCEAFCQEIAIRRARLEQLLARGDLADPEVETTLLQIGEWRARCQANMLRYFRAMADTMTPEQGKRFLEVMTRLTLGAHETIEARMIAGEDAAAIHGHQH